MRGDDKTSCGLIACYPTKASLLETPERKPPKGKFLESETLAKLNRRIHINRACDSGMPRRDSVRTASSIVHPPFSCHDQSVVFSNIILRLTSRIWHGGSLAKLKPRQQLCALIKSSESYS